MPATFPRRSPGSGGISVSMTARRSARGWDGFAARRACRIFPPRSTACSRTASDGRTARQVRALVDQGITDLPELMRRLHALEAPKHGVWYGDAIVRRLAILRDDDLADHCRSTLTVAP